MPTTLSWHGTTMPKHRAACSLPPLLVFATLILIGLCFHSPFLMRANNGEPTCQMSGGRRGLWRSEAPSLTVFSAPTAPFAEDEEDPQFQALLSWLDLGPSVRVVLLGRDPSLRRAAGLFPCGRVSVEPRFDRNMEGTPLFHSILKRAQQAPTLMSALVDPRTILLPDFLHALRHTHNLHRTWVLFGKHWDLLPSPLSFVRAPDGSTACRVHTRHNNLSAPTNVDRFVKSHGSLHAGPSVAYWAWTNDPPSPLFNSSVPPFSLVRGTYEAWVLRHLVDEATSRAVVDASEAISSLRAPSKTSQPPSASMTSSWEADLNMHMSSMTDVPNTTIDAPWKLMVCAEAPVHTLCMIPQGKEKVGGSKYDDSSSASSASHVISPSSSLAILEEGPSQQQQQQQLKGLTHPWEKSVPRPHTLDDLLPQVANENKVVVMVGGTSNYKEMLLSFVCRAQSLGVDHVLVAAFDEALHEYAYMQGLPVYLESKAQDDTSIIGSDEHCVFASECFKQVSKLKSWSVLRVLKKGYSVLWSDMDIVWFKNPLPELYHLGPGTFAIQSDVPGDEQPENDIFGANSGFYLARAEDQTIRAFEAIVAHAKQSSTTEQPSFYHVLCGDEGERRVGTRECKMEETGLRTIFLSHEKYPNGFVFGHWETKDPAASCLKYDCALLHNNYIAGKENKLHRLVINGLWFYDVPGRMCLHPWHPMAPKHAVKETFQTYHLLALNS